MLTETFDQNTNNKDAKISSETLEGKGTSNHFDSNPEVFDGSKGSVDSEGLIYIATGGKRENPQILGSDIDNKHVKISSETPGGKGTGNHFDSNLEVFDGSKSRMDSVGLIEITTGDIRENPDILGSDVNDVHVKIYSEVLVDITNSNTEVHDGSESSKDLEGLVDTTNGGERENPDILGSDINIKHVNISSETLDGEETSDHSDSNSLVSDNSKSSMDSEGLTYITTGGKRESPEILGSHNNNYFKSNIKGTKSILIRAEVSSSSSSEESSSNFIHVRKVKFAEFSVSKSASEDEWSDVSHESPVKSEASNKSSVPTSTSQVYSSTHGHMGMSPTVRPPIQVMDRSSEYDPRRIPSSVFASKGNSVDWSINSSESLFSIQLGNPSLSRDLACMSYELGKSMEFINSGELNASGPVPSAVIENRDTGKKSVEMEDLEITEVLDKDFKPEQRLSKNKNEEKDSHSSETSIVSSHSHGNGTDANPSALPIKKKCTWPSCYCSNCSTAFCYYKLPSCHYSCSSCCLSFPSCCCSYERDCSHSSPVLTEAEIVSSIQADSPQQQSSNISSEVTSSSTSNCCNWCQCQCFSWSCCTWFTCCSQTDSAQHQLSNESSEVISSSTSNCCNWCQCQCLSWSCFSCSGFSWSCFSCSGFSWSCCSCSGFSWSCCTWFTCCSQTGSPLQQSYDKDSEKTSSSTSSCCSWFQCCSWSCCSWGKCRRRRRRCCRCC